MATSNCTQCGKPVAPGSAFCTQCGARVNVAPVTADPNRPAPATSTPPTPVGGAPAAAPTPASAARVSPPARPRICVNCKTQMAPMGAVSFRTGGWVGGTGVLAGGWNAAAESLQPFSLYYCQQCGKFDLYYAGT
jgi:hypothetical protein